MKRAESSIIKISGGLGNQLFQLGAAFQILKLTGIKPLLEIGNYHFNPSKYRDLHIQKLNADISFINFPNRIAFFVSKLSTNKRIQEYLYNRNCRFIENRSQLRNLPVQKEIIAPFDISIDFSKNSYFIGSFVSPIYWGTNSEIIFQNIENLILTDRIEPINKSLALHARRGDYIKSNKTRHFHGYCTTEYFVTAVKRALDSNPEIERIVLASDDLQYLDELREALIFTKLEIELYRESDPIQLLRHFSSYRHFIGSNSTLSWWIGHLGIQKNLYFPEKWFMGIDASLDFIFSRILKLVTIQNAISNSLVE